MRGSLQYSAPPFITLGWVIRQPLAAASNRAAGRPSPAKPPKAQPMPVGITSRLGSGSAALPAVALFIAALLLQSVAAIRSLPQLDWAPRR